MNLANKVDKNRITEKEYRSLKERLSYSLIRLFDSDREKFFKEVVLGEKSIRKETAGLVLGSLVHSLLSGIEGDFDSKFHIASAKIPKPQMLKLCENLYTRSLQSINEFGEQQDKFKVIFSDAVQRTKYNFNQEEVEFKGKDETKILEMFEGSDAEMYYREMMECVGKTIVSIPQIEQAERMVQKIKENPVTERYANTQTEWLDQVRDIKGIEVYNELPILFEMDGVLCKCLPDKLFINHIQKIIEPIDWKTSWQSSETIEGVYTKLGYYLQAGFYDCGLEHFQKEHGLEDYERLPMKFVFCDTGGFSDPFVLKLSKDDIDRSMRGFKVRSYKYKGVRELIKEISWHLETGKWTQSYNEYKNNGVISLSLPYGSR